MYWKQLINKSIEDEVAVITDASPATSSPLILAGQRCVKISPFWLEREGVWLRCMPAMLENVTPWEKLFQGIKSTPIELGGLPGWVQHASCFASVHQTLLPDFPTTVKASTLESSAALLEITAPWKAENPALEVASVDLAVKLSEHCVAIEPTEGVFCAHSGRLKKLLNVMGSKAVKRDLCAKAKDLAENLTCVLKRQALCKCIEMANGVDLTDASVELQPVLQTAARAIYNGDTCAMTKPEALAVIESFSSIAHAATHAKLAFTFKIQESIVDLIYSHHDFRSLGGGI